MKSSILLLALVAGGAAGAGSALLTGLALPGDGDDVQLAAAPGGAPSDEIAHLRQQNADLAERLRVLEGQLSLRANERTTATEPTQSEFDVAGLEALLASLNQPDQPAPAGLQRMVERALDDKEAREDAQRQEEERIRREERLDERMVKMSEELGLDNVQQQDVRAALWERDETINAMWREMREAGGGRGGFGGGDRDAVREKFSAVRDKANQTIQASLSPAQFEMYTEEYDNDRWGRGGFDGGRGGRGN